MILKHIDLNLKKIKEIKIISFYTLAYRLFVNLTRSSFTGFRIRPHRTATHSRDHVNDQNGVVTYEIGRRAGKRKVSRRFR